jgi:hypothetical protein
MFDLSMLQISIGNAYLVETQIKAPALNISTKFAKDRIVGSDNHK